LFLEFVVLCLADLLDYESSNQDYSVVITVSDGTFSTTIDVDIAVTDVNDGPPVFSSATYSGSISETAVIGASIVTVTATDPDYDPLYNTGSNGVVVYSIQAGNTDNKFMIDPGTGVISKAGILDADTTSTYTLTVRAKQVANGATNFHDATVTITVTGANDNDPACTSAMAFSETMSESAAANHVLFSFVCSDADGQTPIYTLTSGDATYFQITGTDLTVSHICLHNFLFKTLFSIYLN